jgi:parallel beta-helix repeat protein
MARSLTGALAGALLGAVSASAAIQATYYVDPLSGSDSNNGTSTGTPFATLTKARDVVRTVNASMTGDIVISLMAGDYFVTAPIALNETDSGTNGHDVVWTCYGPRGSARLIGGTKATGWTLDSGSVYKTALTVSGPRLQAIYENGAKGHLARHPNSPTYWRIDTKDGTSPKKKFQWKTGNSLPTVAKPTDLQVFVWPGDRDWSTEIRDVASVAYSTRWITLTSNLQQTYLGALDPESRYFVQGARELLDEKGEFYHDPVANVLYYWPRTTPIANQEIIVPAVTTIFNAVASPTTNLQARWMFEGNAGDSSAGGNDGETVEDPVYVTGPTGFGDALSLDASLNQYVTVPHASTLTFGAPSAVFTVAGWIKSSTASGAVQPAISKARPETTGVDIDYRFGLDANAKLQFYRWNADSGGGAESVTDANGASLNDGSWHHIAFVNESASSHKLYVDGSLVETSTTTWAYNDSNEEPLEIGKYSNLQGGIFNYFNGALDDLRVYQSALTATDVGNVYLGTDTPQKLEHIAFTNLQFLGTNLDSNNYTGASQGMIYCENASNITITDNEFSAIGGSAVNTSGAGSGLVVTGNHISDAGIAGVTLHSATASLVSNNRIDNTAQVFPNAGSNITLSDCTDSVVSYNLVSISKRQGISLRNASYNLVNYNEVYGMDQDSQDTGAVKWGQSDHNSFDHNRIHDSGDAFGQQHGMYIEDGSDYSDVTNNIIYAIGNAPSNASTAPINVKGVANVIFNNIFDFTKSHAALRTFEIKANGAANNEQVLSNIFYSGTTSSNSTTFYDFQSYASNRIDESDSNVFRKTASGSNLMENIPGDDTLSNWKTLRSNRYDQASITTDPGFVDAANHNYAFTGSAPLSFAPIDTRQIGLRPEFIYPGTRGQWVFSGSAADLSGHGHTGTVTGGSYVADWTGTAASALSLNGSSDYVNIADDALLDFGSPANPFSIVAWVKTSGGAAAGIVAKARDINSVNMDYRLQMLATGAIQFTRWNQSAGAVDTVTTSTTVNNGSWHHVAFVNEGAGSHKLYIDGVLATSSATTWTYDNSNAEPVRIGRDRNGTSSDAYFNGVIDDVAIIQRALTAAQIQDLNHLPHP